MLIKAKEKKIETAKSIKLLLIKGSKPGFIKAGVVFRGQTNKTINKIKRWDIKTLIK